MLSLAPNIAAATIEDRIVVLDITRDRYDLLSGRLAAALVSILEVGICSDEQALVMLRQRGYVSHERVRRSVTMVPPSHRSALDGGPATLLAPHTLRRAIVAARISLRLFGLERTLRCSLARSQLLKGDDRTAGDHARGFADRRPAVGIARRCLPDALALRTILNARGCRAALVLGVRLEPFKAHAWLQAGDTALTDRLELLVPYTAILVS
jgi:hypothetical protein